MKYLFALLLFIPLCSMAQEPEETDYLSQIPVKNSKVVFSEAIAFPAGMTKSDASGRLSTILSMYLSDKRGFMKLNDTINHQIALQIFNDMEIEKKSLSIFTMWAKYDLHIDYSGDSCRMEINNIMLIEPDSENAKKILTRKRNISDSANDGSFSAEDVFLKKRYKVAFVPNAANKIAKHLIADVEKFHSLLEKELKQ